MEKCSALPSISKKEAKSSFTSDLVAEPFQQNELIIVSLEKIGGPSEEAEPSNVVTGLAKGTKSVVSSVFSAIAGIVAEPVKGG